MPTAHVTPRRTRRDTPHVRGPSRAGSPASANGQVPRGVPHPLLTAGVAVEEDRSRPSRVLRERLREDDDVPGPTRGFLGRRRTASDPRLPPGQYDVGGDWPV